MGISSWDTLYIVPTAGHVTYYYLMNSNKLQYNRTARTKKKLKRNVHGYRLKSSLHIVSKRLEQ